MFKYGNCDSLNLHKNSSIKCYKMQVTEVIVVNGSSLSR